MAVPSVGGENSMTGAVSVRQLADHTSRVVRTVEETSKATLITKRRRPVAVLAPIDADGLLDHIFANAPEYIASIRQADENLTSRRTKSLRDVLAEVGN